MTQLTLPELKEGEINAGLIMTDGVPAHWLILLPGDNDEDTWDAQMAWAKDQDGELPTRRELNLLRANAKEQFKDDWYWSGEQRASHSDYAWCQTFLNGYQGYWLKGDLLRARAVRRSVI